MRLTHFFQGSLRREEVTSAFLAMALEGLPNFRRYFFQFILPDEAVVLGERHWNVRVEEDYVDVRMDAGDTLILIENKVNSGARQQGQLLRYYVGIRQQKPYARIIAVYLAPGQIGKDEVEKVKNAQTSANDYAQHISWEKLVAYPSDSNDMYDALIRSGLNEVQRIINEARVEKYPSAGDREIIRSIVDKAFNLLTEQPTVSLRRWSGREFEQIFTVGTNVTLWLDAAFETGGEPPFSPINFRDESGQIQITIRSQIKLAGKVKKHSALAQWWRQQIGVKGLEVPGVGAHYIRENGWFVYEGHFSGTEEAIARELVRTGEAVLRTLSYYLSQAGFELASANKGVV